MSSVWAEYEKTVNEDELNRQIKDARANTFEDLPAGEYNVELSRLEPKMSKNGKPMVSVSMKVIEGKYRGRLMFMNRVIGGTKNDGRMIAGLETWLEHLEAEDENGDLITVRFHDLDQFSDLVLDIAESVKDMGLQYQLTYDSKAFNTIEIDRVLD